MLNNTKGSTLIEALFAFSIYVVVLVMFVSLLTTLNKTSVTLAKKQKEKIQYEESYGDEGGDAKSMLEKALK